MKKCLLSLFFLSTGFSINVLATSLEESDLRSNEEFVATCPEKFLTYIDKIEGGSGAYCACPDENINYIDYNEGGPGFICLEKSN